MDQNTNEKKLKALWKELLEAIDRDDGDAFRAALARVKIPEMDGWSDEEAIAYAQHYVLQHIDEVETMRKLMQGIWKYCPEDYSAAGKVAPLSDWDLSSW